MTEALRELVRTRPRRAAIVLAAIVVLDALLGPALIAAELALLREVVGR